MSSYVEEEHWEGRGEDRMLVKTRKVRLAEKHGPCARSLEAKGAFDKRKRHLVPPRSSTSTWAACRATGRADPASGRTINMDVGRLAKGKKSPVRPGQSTSKAGKRQKAVLERPTAMSKVRQIEAKSVEISTVSEENVTQITKQADTVEISTPQAKPDLF